VVDDMVESVKSIVCIFHSIDFGDLRSAGNDDYSLNVRESLGDNSSGYRLLVLACDSHK
jgi:hypothetical protein